MNAPTIAAIMLGEEYGIRRVTIAAVIQACAAHYGVSPGLLTEPEGFGSRLRWIVRKRQLAMFVARELTDASLWQIGDHFGHRHHSTILHGCRQVKKLLKASDRYTTADVRAIMKQLGVLEIPGGRA